MAMHSIKRSLCAGACFCRHASNAQEWRRLVLLIAVTLCVGIFLLHTLLSLTSQPPAACGATYTEVPEEVESKNKILLVAYYRGGSSFFGKLFQSNDDVLYWFEPLRPLHGDFKYHLQHERNATEDPQSHLGLCPEPCADEHKKDTSVLRAIFACDIATILNLSQQIIAYAQMRLYVPTLPLLFDRLGKFNPLPYRIQPGCIAGKCQKADTLAVKTIRLRMRYVEPLLNYDPNIKVVYYSRDPRGIMSSLTKLREVHSNTIAGMCAVMEDDFKYYKLLKASYPNRVRWVRYEDLALNTAQVSRDIYNFSTGQECVPRSVQSWIAHNTQVPRSEYTGITGTKRNSSANAREWKKIISDDRKQEIERTCSKVLTMLKYNADY